MSHDDLVIPHSEKLADHGARLDSLEDWRGVTDPQLRELIQLTASMAFMTKMMWITISALAVSAGAYFVKLIAG